MLSRRKFVGITICAPAIIRSRQATAFRSGVNYSIPYKMVTPGAGAGFPNCTSVSYLESADGINWVTPSGVTNPVISVLQMSNGSGGTKSVGDSEGCSVLNYKNQSWWIIYDQVGNTNYFLNDIFSFGVAKSTTGPQGPYVYQGDIVPIPSVVTNAIVCEMRWFIDHFTGNIYALMCAANGAPTTDSGMFPWLMKCNDPGTFSNFSAPVILNNGVFPKIAGGNISEMLSCCIIDKVFSPNGRYSLFFKDEQQTNKYGLAQSDSLTSGYQMIHDPASDFFGLGAAEYGNWIKRSDRWRAYATPNGSQPANYIDSFDNWNTWTAPQATSGPWLNGWRDIAVIGYPNNVVN